VGVTDFLVALAGFFTVGFLFRANQTAVRRKVLHQWKAADVMDFIQHAQRQDFSHTGDGLQQVKGIGVMGFGVFEDLQFYVLQQLVVSIDHSQVDLDAFIDAGVLEAFSNPLAIGFVSDLFANHR